MQGRRGRKTRRSRKEEEEEEEEGERMTVARQQEVIVHSRFGINWYEAAQLKA